MISIRMLSPFQKNHIFSSKLVVIRNWCTRPDSLPSDHEQRSQLSVCRGLWHQQAERARTLQHAAGRYRILAISLHVQVFSVVRWRLEQETDSGGLHIGKQVSESWKNAKLPTGIWVNISVQKWEFSTIFQTFFYKKTKIGLLIERFPLNLQTFAFTCKIPQKCDS